MRHHSRGFTLVEMLVVAPIVILAIGGFLTVLVSLTGQVIASRAENVMTLELGDTARQIENDIRLSNGFVAENSVTLSTSNAQGFNDDDTAFTNIADTNGQSLILEMTATTGNPSDVATEQVYLINQPNACGDRYRNDTLTYNIVYFVKDSTLWRRTIMPDNYANTSTTVCDTPWQQPSCAPTYMDAQSGPVFCQTNDVALIRGVEPEDFTVEYYGSATTTYPNPVAVSTTASASERNDNLALLNTARVVVTATQLAAGRDVTSTMDVRTTRYETAFAVPDGSGEPAAGLVVASTIEPGATAEFTWPAVSGATGYTIGYRIDGGSWQTGFSNQNTRTYTVDTAYSGAEVEARVAAHSSSGMSAYEYETASIPTWQDIALNTGWSHYGDGTPVAQYTRTASGVVMLRGSIEKSSSPITGETIATLPAPLRPGYDSTFITAVDNPSTGGGLRVAADGNIEVVSAASAHNSLNRIAFLPASTDYTWTDLTSSLASGWTDLAGDGPPPRYAIDSSGRIHLEGDIANGNYGNNTPAINLPSAAQNNPKYIVPVRDANSFNKVDISTGVMTRSQNPDGHFHISFMYLPESASGWTAMTMQNSWGTHSSSNASPAYTKTSDGVVSLKGLISGGSTTTGVAISTLPSGYRPDGNLVFISMCNNGPCYITVETNGVISGMGHSSSYTSLSGINFRVE